MKKKIAIFFLALVVSVIGCVGFRNSVARASQSATSKSDVVTYIEKKQAPEQEGKLFAGWYEDEAYTKPIKTKDSVPETGAYAKFVDEDVLSIKLQAKQVEDEKVNMRIVTSVDSQQYYRVGFDIQFNDNVQTNYETYKVMERIQATEKSGDLTYDYSPNVIDTDSKYFVSATIANISKTKLDKYFYIRPYWKTLDGTKVYGVSRYVSVADGQNDKIINLPVKITAVGTNLHAGETAAVTFTHYNLMNTPTTKETATVIKVENGYVHLNIPLTQVSSKSGSFNSATLVVIDNTTNCSIYRNLQKSNKDIDVSWYRAYAKDNRLKDSKYVITTVADLYGLAEIVNSGSDNIQEHFFSGKEVQLCANIEVNAKTDFDATQFTAAPAKTWAPIGSGTSQFQGTFDGKNNTISGLYIDSSDTYVGLFAKDNGDAKYKNLKIENSYIKSTASNGYTGSVVAYSKGNFDNIRSAAVIVCTSTSECGGLVGQMLGDRAKTVSNCGYTGEITTSGYDCGGLIGRLNSSGTVTILNCENTGTLLSSQENFGGLIGRNGSTADTVIKNCQNAGSITSSSKMIGGIIGKNTSTSVLEIENCLNQGTVTYNGTGAEPNVGGVIGRAEAGAKVTIRDSLNTGSLVLNMSTNSNSTMYFVGSVIGRVGSSTGATVTFSNMYDTNAVSVSKTGITISEKEGIIGLGSGASKNTNNQITGKPHIVSASDILGEKGYALTKLDFREDGIWVAVSEGTPELAMFTEKTPLNLYGVHRIDIDWYSDSKSSFTISTSDELYGLAYLVDTKDKRFNGKTITLAADITVNPDTWNAKADVVEAPEYSWTPIGATRTFQGTFSGLDATTGKVHTIRGLYATSSGQMLGLFGQVNEKGSICNLKLENSYFESTYGSNNDGDRAFAGSIAGCTKGNVTGVYSDAVVVGSHYGVGGLLGSVTGNSTTEIKTISDCWFAGTVKLTGANGRRGGGLVGTIGAGGLNGGVVNMEHCLYTGKMELPATGKGPQSGGIIGRVEKGNCNINDSLSAGQIVGTDYVTQTGTVVGFVCGGTMLTLEDVYAAKGCISCTNPPSGYTPNKDAAVGINGIESNATVNGSTVVMEKTKLHGSDGYKETTLDFAEHWVAIEGDVPQLRCLQKGKAADLSGVMRVDTSWYKESETNFSISNAEELYGLAYLVNKGNAFENKTISLTQDITVNPDTWDANAQTVTVPEYTWTAIAQSNNFKGTFDGGNHTIRGLYQKGDTTIGLFGYIRPEGTVKNVQLKNCYFESTGNYLGSIAGYTKGTIENVYSNAHLVSTGNYVGGITGAVTDTCTHNLSNCWFDGVIETSGRHCGGMTGAVWAGTTTIKDCLFTGTILSKTSNNEANVGGFIGSAVNGSSNVVLTIETSLSAGVIDASQGTGTYTGSVVGNNRANSTLTLTNVYATEECYQYQNEVVMIQGASGAVQNGTPTAVKRDSILNELGSTVLSGFDFTTVWTNRSNDVPALLAYADEQRP